MCGIFILFCFQLVLIDKTIKPYEIKQIFEKIRISTLGFESSRSPAKLALRFESGFDESLIRANTSKSPFAALTQNAAAAVGNGLLN
jgi:hypothetical protein